MAKDQAVTSTMVKNFEKARPEFEKLGEEFGIDFPENPMELLLGAKNDMTIVFTSKYYQPNAELFDDTYKFVGPSIFDRHELEDFKIDNPENKKIIYISLGTVANDNLQFYKNCFEALGSRKDLIVIMSAGKKIDINDLGQIPQNFKVYTYVPQLEVLKKIYKLLDAKQKLRFILIIIIMIISAVLAQMTPKAIGWLTDDILTKSEISFQKVIPFLIFGTFPVKL